jgi:apolipoprotein N-acyltransferase
VDRRHSLSLSSRRLSWLWLALAAALGLVASGSWTVPLATWLSGVFLLRFTRAWPPFRGYLVAVAVTVPVLATSWSIFPFGGAIGLAIFSVVVALIGSLPLLLDGWLAPERGLARTLVFPAAATSLEFLGGMNDDFGSWGAMAYTQLDHPALLQVVSVFGLAGISFLVAWLAAVVNGLWESEWDLRGGGTPVVFAGVMALVLGFGSVRLRLADHGAETTRVAALTTPGFRAFPDQSVRKRYRGDAPLSMGDRDAIQRAYEPRNSRLLEVAEREATAGARLVLWPEAAAVVLESDEEAFLARGRELAAASGITLGMAVGVLDEGPAPRRITNKLVVITPDGRQSDDYLKAIPTPGGERAWSRRGDGSLQVIETPVGRVAGVICYDADFPALIAQAGAADVDLLLVPAGDWDDVATMHAGMARLRAIEQGVNILRPASAGLSTAIDTTGSIRADHRWTSEQGVDAMVAWLPTEGRPTPYRRIGDAFGWASVVGLALLVLLAIGRRFRAPST